MSSTKNICYSCLENVNVQDICDCAAMIFNDVKINGKIDDDDYKKRLTDGNYSPSLSCGAFLNNKLIGIIIVGLNSYLNKTTAYNIITGVISEHRDRKITSNMMKRVVENLKKKKIELFCLEVMCNNSGAIRTYQKFGFATNRTLMSFVGKNKKYKMVSAKLTPFNSFDFSKISNLKTFVSTFNNSFFSMKARSEDHEVYHIEKNKTTISVIVMDKKNNTVRYYADNEKRDNIEKIIKYLQSKNNTVFFKDVDNKDKELIKLLIKLNFQNISNQYEMFLNLT